MKLFLAGAALLAATSAHAATLSATGVKGLNVGTATYDVAFVEGSCASLFNGCDDTSDFYWGGNFSGLVQAMDALRALFNAPGNEIFTNVPSSSAGCTDRTACRFSTPYQVPAAGLVDVVEYINVLAPSISADYVQPSHWRTTDDLSFFAQDTWAVWSVTPPSGTVPVPASALLLGSTMIIGALSRRRTR